jgi:hypothetical protein
MGRFIVCPNLNNAIPSRLKQSAILGGTTNMARATIAVEGTAINVANTIRPKDGMSELRKRRIHRNAIASAMNNPPFRGSAVDQLAARLLGPDYFVF